MEMDSASVTQLLKAMAGGNARAASDLFPLVYASYTGWLGLTCGARAPITPCRLPLSSNLSVMSSPIDSKSC